MQKNGTEVFNETITETQALFDGGIPEAEYYGQTVWNGEKLVTPEEWKNSLPNSSPVDMQRR
jgi:hypothetical protein